MSEPRLKAKVVVQSIVRRAANRGVFATVMHSGDDDAGAIFIKIVRGRNDCTLLAPSRRPEDDKVVRVSVLKDGVIDEMAADEHIARERRIDPDLWLVEIEDRDGWNPMAEDD